MKGVTDVSLPVNLWKTRPRPMKFVLAAATTGVLHVSSALPENFNTSNHFAVFTRSSLVWSPRKGSSLGPRVCKLVSKNESLGYTVVKAEWSYEHLSSYGTGLWRQMERQHHRCLRHFSIADCHKNGIPWLLDGANSWSYVHLFRLCNGLWQINGIAHS